MKSSIYADELASALFISAIFERNSCEQFD